MISRRQTRRVQALALPAVRATSCRAGAQAPARQAAGLTDGLLRLSVGIEALEDLRADLAAGMSRAAAL